MKTFNVAGEARTELGKSAIKQYRAAGRVPATLTRPTEDNLFFSVDAIAIKKAIYTPETFLINLELDGGSFKAIAREVQTEPVHDNILHIDFVEVLEDRPVNVELPIDLVGQSPGVLAGGKLVKKLRKLKVKGLYSNLPDRILVDISTLRLGHSLTVADVKADGFEVLSTPDIAICSISIPRALRQEAAKSGK
jgi:large subunit ribosomal protein L25